MNRYSASFAERVNAGAAIPEVDPKDLTSALQFFADLRAHHAGTDENQASAPPGYAFLCTALAQRCRPDADVLAVAMRALALEAVLDLDRAKPGRQRSGSDEVVVQALAKMHLVAAELRDPAGVRRRALGVDSSRVG